jgi:3-hydroxybutyryl-CoA dehydrogenase
MNIQKVGIVGVGTMGQGLAETIAEQGFEVILLDKAEYDLEKAKLGLELSLSRRVTKREITDEEKKLALSRIVLCTNLHVLKECQLIIESIEEDLQEKVDVLQETEEVVAPEAVLASGTSTLSITELAAHLQHPERMVGLHIHHPVQEQHVVVVVRGM